MSGARLTTEEIFRNNAYARECEAIVTAVSEAGVVLNRTVFYPEGGGQPGDRGMLFSAAGTFTIIDTRKGDAGSLLHVPQPGAALPVLGTQLTARIDWDYRYRHMRTHTCLHLLCALLPYDVTGGSISQDKGRLDFDMPDALDKDALERDLNRLIAAGHAVDYRWISEAELAANSELVRTLSVKPPSGQGQVRLVEISGIDLQPCGGTHVARTGEIGLVEIGKVEKKGKQNRRINLHLK